MTVGVLPVAWEPPWVGCYAWDVWVSEPGWRARPLPWALWARVMQVRPGVFELVLPAAAGVGGFEVQGSEARLRLPPGTSVRGIEVGASALHEGRRVDVVRAEDDGVLVSCAAGTRLVGPAELDQVVMDAYRFSYFGSLPPRTVDIVGRIRWRAVLPSAERRVCDGLAGALSREVWPSPFVGPVPSSGDGYAVVDSVMLAGTRGPGSDVRRPGTVYWVSVPGWAPEPSGISGSYKLTAWSSTLAEDGEVDGGIEIGQVAATWRGRRVEIMYVAYAYAYVIDYVEDSGYLAHRSLMHGEGELMFSRLQGPVRLDELYDIEFDVDVVWRSPGAGPWPFFRLWGLDPEMTGRARAHMDRGGWPAWPWEPVVEGGATHGGGLRDSLV